MLLGYFVEDGGKLQFKTGEDVPLDAVLGPHKLVRKKN
jgi:hypothetical protein